MLRFSSLGDCILLGPLFRGLRKRFPEHRLFWMTKSPYHTIWEGTGWIDGTILYSKNSKDWLNPLNELSIEYLYDVQSSFESWKALNRIQSKIKRSVRPPRLRRWLTIYTRWNFLTHVPPVPLRYLSVAKQDGVHDDGEGLHLPIHHHPIEHFPKETEPPIIALAHGSKHFTKCWKWDNFREIANRLLQRNMRVLWMVGPYERDKLSEIRVLATQFPNQVFTTSVDWHFHDLFSAIARCQAIVTNDSAAMHIAVATNRKGIALFGPTIQSFGFAPFRSQLTVLEKEIECRPCSAHGTKVCPLNHHRCMEEIAVEEVWMRLATILKS
ncbi:MAG: glycosyltransferase family 9 protein [bacterium]|nr:glycosyltransferase family 9 protein [bacterium]